MKTTILKENFNKGLDIVQRATGKNLTLPILNDVLLETDKNFLKLSATNLEIGLRYWILAKNQEEGKATVPAKTLSSFISSIPEDKVILKNKNYDLLVEGDNYKTQIKGENPDDFPIIPKIESQDYIEVNPLPLSKGLSQVINFCSVSQARPEISGVYFVITKNKASFVSTDSFRLAQKTLYFEEPVKKSYSFIIPRAASQEIINIFSSDNLNNNEKIRLYVSPNQVLFESLFDDLKHPKTQLISRLIEGEYPSYEEIIPKKFKTEVVLPKKDFLNQIKIASLFSSKTNEIKVKIDSKKEEITTESQSSDIGASKSKIKGQVKGEDLTIYFNYRFLEDGLSQIEGPDVVLKLNGQEGAVLIKGVDDDSYFYIVMPIKPQ